FVGAIACYVYLYLPCVVVSVSLSFFSTYTATTEIYTLSLHDALPILAIFRQHARKKAGFTIGRGIAQDHQVHAAVLRSNTSTDRSEEHTSELQSRFDLVCRLLLEKKKKSYSKGKRNAL